MFVFKFDISDIKKLLKKLCNKIYLLIYVRLTYLVNDKKGNTHTSETKKLHSILILLNNLKKEMP